MGKLIGAGNVPTGIYIWNISLHILIDLDRSPGAQLNPQLLQTKSGRIRFSSQSNQESIERHFNRTPIMFTLQKIFSVTFKKLFRGVL